MFNYSLCSNLVAVAMLLALSNFIAPERGAASVGSSDSFQSQFRLRQGSSPSPTAQNEEADFSEVSPDEIEKYVSVYKAMQRNRKLTVDQAVKAQGLTLKQFRALENRVQRDDAALEQARTELQAAAEQRLQHAE